jgi:hypothetical protein
MRAGHSLLTDDVRPLRRGSSIMVEPSERPALLFPDTAEHLGAQVGANIYRRQLLAPLFGREMFDWAKAVASAVPVYLTRVSSTCGTP